MVVKIHLLDNNVISLNCRFSDAHGDAGCTTSVDVFGICSAALPHELHAKARNDCVIFDLISYVYRKRLQLRGNARCRIA